MWKVVWRVVWRVAWRLREEDGKEAVDVDLGVGVGGGGATGPEEGTSWGEMGVTMWEESWLGEGRG